MTEQSGSKFVLLGNSSSKVATPLTEIVELLKRYGQYEIRHKSAELRIRRPEESAKSLSTESFGTVFDSASSVSQTLRLSAVVERYKHAREYSDPHRTQGLLASLAEIKEIFPNDVALQSPTTRAWELVGRVIFRAHPDELFAVMDECVLPVFKRWFPNGKVLAFAHNPKYEVRFSLLRALRVASQFHVSSFMPDVPTSLASWQMTGNGSLFELILDWASLLTFPKIASVNFGQFGICFVFVNNDGIAEYSPPNFPLSLLEHKWSHAQFGRPRAGMEVGDKSIKLPVTTYLDRHCWTQDVGGFSVLLEWIAERATALLRAVSDVTNYVPPDAGGHPIDWSWPQEQLWTIDRIIRRTVQVQSAEAPFVNQTAVFEIADCWSELRGRWTKEKVVNSFKRLFAPSAPADYLNQCFGTIPEPWKSRFIAETSRVYSGTKESVIHSVWAKSKFRDNGIDLAERAGESQIETWDEFIPNLFRALRNTHHGYTPQHDQESVRRRLLLSDGDFGWEFTYLPAIWLLAFLGDPRVFIGWPKDADGF
ncbi:MAG: hypothetical protein U0573_12585 [Phycisphaerales bacterium]|nr:hypothetical protein [Planctomycetota bacterium]